MFGKDAAARPESRGAGTEGTLSILAASVRIVGNLETTGTLKIDGRVEGSVSGARQLMLGRGGSIQGDVSAEEVVIGGTVDGGVRAATRIELQASAVVNGDIETKSIVVLEGARINGTVRMTDVAARISTQVAKANQ